MAKKKGNRPANPAWASYRLKKKQGTEFAKIACGSLVVAGLALLFSMLAYFFPRGGNQL